MSAVHGNAKIPHYLEDTSEWHMLLFDSAVFYCLTFHGEVFPLIRTVTMSRWRTSLVFLENRKDRHVDREFPWGLGSFCLVLDRHHSSSRTTRSHKTQRSLPMFSPHEGGPVQTENLEVFQNKPELNSPKTAATKQVYFNDNLVWLKYQWQQNPVSETGLSLWFSSRSC